MNAAPIGAALSPRPTSSWSRRVSEDTLGYVTSQAKRLYDAALSLSEQERLELMQALADSFEPTTTQLPPPWTEEVGNRIAQLESGEVEPVEWADAEAKIRATLERR